MARWPIKPRQEKKKETKGKAMSMIGPYFFKVLVRSFATKLMVPPAFVKNFKGSLPTKVRAGSPPVTWNVKMNIKQAGCFLMDGWEKIVRDLDLKLGDVLLFRLVTDDVLDVVAFDPTCCEKKIDVKSNGKGVIKEEDCAELIHCGVDSDEEDESKLFPSPDSAMANNSLPSTSKEFRYISHLKTLVRHEMLFLQLPTWISNQTGQWNKESALIRNSKGQEWSVDVKLRKNRYRRVDFSSGWRNFIRDNGLTPGDTIRLDFKGGKKNLVNVVVPR